MSGKSYPTIERLRELLAYDPETGVLAWRVSRGSVRAGAVVGCPHTKGYLVVRVDGALLKAHRVAWAIHTGAWPLAEIDHVDGAPANNRFANLREATCSENSRNRKRRTDNQTGIKGVGFHKVVGRFQARIMINGRYTRLGYFRTAEEAAAAYRAKAREVHGEFFRAE